jgi:hypothetical protein
MTAEHCNDSRAGLEEVHSEFLRVTFSLNPFSSHFYQTRRRWFYRFLRLWSGNKGFRRLWSGMKGFRKVTIGWTKNHVRHHSRQTGHVNIPVRWVWFPGGRRPLVLMCPNEPANRTKFVSASGGILVLFTQIQIQT